MSNIQIRPVKAEDRESILQVEAKSTPNLQYLPQLFEMFLTDNRGEFFLAEMDGAIVACAKFTAVADGSAWLETVRVIPERQGLGVGKRLYQRYAEVAKRDGIGTMRMYTGLRNKVSKGLAEYNGFQLEETFLGYSHAAQKRPVLEGSQQFERVTDPAKATELIMANREAWRDFLVMNRTFYRLSDALCAYLAQTNAVYHHQQSQSVLVAGARFMPEQALHIGHFSGDAALCLQFANQLAHGQNAPQISCLFPQSAVGVESKLVAAGYQPNPSPFIVMKYG